MTLIHSAPLACLSCRGKHLKCNGNTPSCTRCAVAGISCVYTQSRRGHVGGRRRLRKAPPLSASFSTLTGVSQPETDPVKTLRPETAIVRGRQSFSRSNSSITESGTLSLEPALEFLIDAYYRYIHPSHPVAIPRKLYLQDRSCLPGYLKACMRFAAAAFFPHELESARQAAQAVFEADVPDDAFKVQGLLIFTLASMAGCERDAGGQALVMASELALKIGLNSETFAKEEHPIWQESWRRTWWELYTITILISLVMNSNVRLAAPLDRSLPSHDQAYQECQISQLKTLTQMQNRFLQLDDFQWSPFAYKVEAARILSEVMDITDDIIRLTSIEATTLDASIASFLLSLPAGAVIDEGEHYDELMSFTLMIINLARICLHFPVSDLAHVATYKTVCGNDRDKTLADDWGSFAFHSSMSLKAANALSSILVGRRSLTTITPCFSCALTFAVTVQMSAFTTQRDSIRAKHLREHIQLALSALATMGKVWKIACVVRQELVTFVQNVLHDSEQAHQAGVAPPAVHQIDLPPISNDEDWLSEFIAPPTSTFPGLSWVVPEHG